MYLISSFEIINGVVPNQHIFFWIATSTADIPADSSNGIKTELV